MTDRIPNAFPSSKRQNSRRGQTGGGGEKKGGRREREFEIEGNEKNWRADN
jgi:hypothetical protein